MLISRCVKSVEQQQLEAGIRALEAQRGLLGDAVVDAMLALARAKLAALVRPDCAVGQTRANAAPVTVAGLPSAINRHWTKSLAADADGRYFYVGIGSNRNIGERGTALERGANCRPKVIFVPFVNGSPSGPPVDFVTGFQADGKTMGRPVGVTVDPKGALIVADDLSNTVWRVTPAR